MELALLKFAAHEFLINIGRLNWVDCYGTNWWYDCAARPVNSTICLSKPSSLALTIVAATDCTVSAVSAAFLSSSNSASKSSTVIL